MGLSPKATCLRCGSENVVPLQHEFGDRYSLNIATDDNTIFNDSFLFVKVDVCKDCGELALRLDTESKLES